MIKPLPEHVLIQKNDTTDAPTSTIIQLLPTKEQMRGYVVAVHDRDSMVEVGDYILFGKNSTKTIKIDDTEYLLLHQNNIMSKIY